MLRPGAAGNCGLGFEDVHLEFVAVRRHPASPDRLPFSFGLEWQEARIAFVAVGQRLD